MSPGHFQLIPLRQPLFRQRAHRRVLGFHTGQMPIARLPRHAVPRPLAHHRQTRNHVRPQLPFVTDLGTDEAGPISPAAPAKAASRPITKPTSPTATRHLQTAHPRKPCPSSASTQPTASKKVATNAKPKVALNHGARIYFTSSEVTPVIAVKNRSMLGHSIIHIRLDAPHNRLGQLRIDLADTAEYRPAGSNRARAPPSHPRRAATVVRTSSLRTPSRRTQTRRPVDPFSAAAQSPATYNSACLSGCPAA